MATRKKEIPPNPTTIIFALFGILAIVLIVFSINDEVGSVGYAIRQTLGLEKTPVGESSQSLLETPPQLTIHLDDESNYPSDTRTPLFVSVTGLRGNEIIQSTLTIDGGKKLTNYNTTMHGSTTYLEFTEISLPLPLTDGEHRVRLEVTTNLGTYTTEERVVIDYTPPDLTLTASNVSTKQFSIIATDIGVGFESPSDALAFFVTNPAAHYQTELVPPTAVDCDQRTTGKEMRCTIALGAQYNPEKVLLIRAKDKAGNEKSIMAGNTVEFTPETLYEEIGKAQLAEVNQKANEWDANPLSEANLRARQSQIPATAGFMCEKINRHFYVFHFMDDDHWRLVMEQANLTPAWNNFGMSLLSKYYNTKQAFENSKNILSTAFTSNGYTPPGFETPKYTLVVRQSQVSSIPAVITTDPNVDVMGIPDAVFAQPPGCIIFSDHAYPPFCWSNATLAFPAAAALGITVNDIFPFVETSTEFAFKREYFDHFKNNNIPTGVYDHYMSSTPAGGITWGNGSTFLFYAKAISPTSFTFNSATYAKTLAHETGHSLGLGHNFVGAEELTSLMWISGTTSGTGPGSGLNLSLTEAARAKASLCSEGLVLQDGIFEPPIPGPPSESYCDPAKDSYLLERRAISQEACEASYSGYEPNSTLLVQKDVTQFCPILYDGAGRLLPTPFAATSDPAYQGNPHFYGQGVPGATLSFCVGYNGNNAQIACTCIADTLQPTATEAIPRGGDTTPPGGGGGTQTDGSQTGGGGGGCGNTAPTPSTGTNPTWSCPAAQCPDLPGGIEQSCKAQSGPGGSAPSGVSVITDWDAATDTYTDHWCGCVEDDGTAGFCDDPSPLANAH